MNLLSFLVVVGVVVGIAASVVFALDWMLSMLIELVHRGLSRRREPVEVLGRRELPSRTAISADHAQRVEDQRLLQLRRALAERKRQKALTHKPPYFFGGLK